MIKDIFLGATAYFKHFSLLSKNSLWGYFMAPLIIGLLLVASITTGAISLSDNLGNFLSGWYKFDFASEFVQTFSTWIGGSLIFILGLILAKYLVMILASPFMSPMAQKIESKGSYSPSLSSQSLSAFQGIMRGLRIALGNIFKELSIILFLLILSFVFPFISPLTVVLIFIVQAYYAGSGNMDYTLERYFGVKESKRFIRNNRGLAIGNGLVFVALLMIGLGFFVAPPLGTMAATPEVLKRLENY